MRTLLAKGMLVLLAALGGIVAGLLVTLAIEILMPLRPTYFDTVRYIDRPWDARYGHPPQVPETVLEIKPLQQWQVVLTSQVQHDGSRCVFLRLVTERVLSGVATTQMRGQCIGLDIDQPTIMAVSLQEERLIVGIVVLDPRINQVGLEWLDGTHQVLPIPYGSVLVIDDTHTGLRSVWGIDGAGNDVIGNQVLTEPVDLGEPIAAREIRTGGLTITLEAFSVVEPAISTCLRMQVNEIDERYYPQATLQSIASPMVCSKSGMEDHGLLVSTPVGAASLVAGYPLDTGIDGARVEWSDGSQQGADVIEGFVFLYRSGPPATLVRHTWQE